MKILVVCRWHGTHAAAFIMEQVEALQELGHEVHYCAARQGGAKGYITLLREIRKARKTWHPDVIHAHYGICGLIACLAAGKTPVVTTYPGSDINVPSIRKISRLCMRMSAYNLFMSKRQIAKVQDLALPEKTAILRYGIMLDLFQPIDKREARRLFRAAKPEEATWSDTDKLVLFSSKFTRPEKNAPLAQEAVKQLQSVAGYESCQLLPLTGGYTKEEMVWLMNAVDAAIVTSTMEGSPQFTKEVMACGTPIVSVDVGDVAEQVEGLDGCYIATSYDSSELASLLRQAISHGKTSGHQHIVNMCLSNELVAEKLMEIYKGVRKHA